MLTSAEEPPILPLQALLVTCRTAINSPLVLLWSLCHIPWLHRLALVWCAVLEERERHICHCCTLNDWGI